MPAALSDAVRYASPAPDGSGGVPVPVGLARRWCSKALLRFVLPTLQEVFVP